MTSRAEEVGAWLEFNGFGTRNSNIFGDRLPDSPNDCIAAIIDGGDSPDRIFGDGTHHDNMTFTILVRNLSHSTAESTAMAIWTKLGNVADEILLGTRYLQIMAINSPAYIPPNDEKERVLFSATYIAKREP